MERSRRLTHAFACATAAAGFLAEPIPALDEILIVPIQYLLAASIAKARDRRLSRVPWGKVSTIIWGGVGLRFVSETASRSVPVVGPAANAVLTLLTTELLGSFVDRALDAQDRSA
jgi:uncharacterized protein (DUF697 family)